MITGRDLIASLMAMSDDELTEVSGLIVCGKDWKEQEAEPAVGGLRGHNLFMHSLTDGERKRLRSSYSL